MTIPHIAQPPQEHLPDYEVELVIVIGKAAKNVSEADALDYVLGYTGANDVRTTTEALILVYLSIYPGILPQASISSFPMGFLQRIR